MMLMGFSHQRLPSLSWLRYRLSHYTLGSISPLCELSRKAIALISVLIGFCYTVVAGIFYATLVNDMGFGEWLRAGGLGNYLLNGRRFGTLFCYGTTALVT